MWGLYLKSRSDDTQIVRQTSTTSSRESIVFFCSVHWRLIHIWKVKVTNKYIFTALHQIWKSEAHSIITWQNISLASLFVNRFLFARSLGAILSIEPAGRSDIIYLLETLDASGKRKIYLFFESSFLDETSWTFLPHTCLVITTSDQCSFVTFAFTCYQQPLVHPASWAFYGQWPFKSKWANFATGYKRKILKGCDVSKC